MDARRTLLRFLSSTLSRRTGAAPRTTVIAVVLALGLALMPAAAAHAIVGPPPPPTCFLPTFGTTSTFTFENDCTTVGGAVTNQYTDGVTGVRFGSPPGLGFPSGVAQSCSTVTAPTLQGGANAADLPSGTHYLNATNTGCTVGEFNSAGMFFECVTVCLSVTGYVGTETITAATDWQVTAYGTDGSVVATAIRPQAAPDGTGHSPLVYFSVNGSHATPIQWVRITPNQGAQSSVWLDDLTYNADPAAVPEYVATVPYGYANGVTIHLHPGGSYDVPVSVNRHNGSNGTITMDASGAPAGVTVTWDTPSWSGTTAGTSTAHIAISPNGPTFTSPATITLDANSSDVGAGTKQSSAFSVPIVVDGTASFPSNSYLLTPACSGQGFLTHVLPPASFAGSLAISALVWDVVDHRDVSSDPGWSVSVASPTTLNFTGTANGSPPVLVDLTRPAGMALNRYHLQVTAAVVGHLGDNSTLDELLATMPMSTSLSTNVMLPPEATPSGLMTAGSTVTLTAAGLCNVTSVLVGNDASPATLTPVGPATFSDGSFTSQKYTFVVPKYATGGKLTLVDGSNVKTDIATISVSTFRNTKGFRFHNYPVNGLVYDDMTRAFGADQTYDTIDLCWPGGCNVQFRDPVAMIWTAIVRMLTVGVGGSGHCFGISATADRFAVGAININSYPNLGLNNTWGLQGDAGPSPDLTTTIQAAHLQQFSVETFGQLVSQASEQALLGDVSFKNRLKQALAQGPALITLRDGFTDGHVVLAYGYEDAGNGQWYVDVYDSNRPYTAGTDTQQSGDYQQHVVSTSRISVNPGGWHFQMAGGWDKNTHLYVPGADWQASWGNLNSGIAVLPYSFISSKQHIPSLANVWALGKSIVAFGSSGGWGARPPVTPTLAAGQVPLSIGGAATGGLVATGAGQPVNLAGTGNGGYTAAALTAGGAAQIDTTARKGTTDTVSPLAGGVGFTPATAKSATVTVAGRSAGGSMSVQVSGVVPAHSPESVSVGKGGLAITSAGGGALAVTATVAAPHGGAPITEAFSVTLKRGEHVSVTAGALRASHGTLALTIVGAHGHRAVTVRTVVARAAVLGAPVLATSVSHRVVKVTATVAFSAPARDAIGSIVVTAYSGRRVVATVTVPVAKLVRGRLSAVLTFLGKPGTYRLSAVATANHAGSVVGAVAVSSTGTVRVT